jgi:hypothetical protein
LPLSDATPIIKPSLNVGKQNDLAFVILPIVILSQVNPPSLVLKILPAELIPKPSLIFENATSLKT